MLNENIRVIRKSKGLSQEELAVKLNVVRQTVSKWEKGLSVPDSEMLVTISEILETPVSTLLGENLEEKKADELKAISQKLEVINLQLANKNKNKIKTIRWLLIALSIIIVTIFIVFALIGSPYLNWDYNDPELAVAGTILHGAEFFFVRLAPFALIVAVICIVLTYIKR
ncbi:MAG: helix-turn-helix transcriptional regulator [Bacteroidaceae bacterium]|nr:helix-turn-helix transcriptional regulator [Bacteroidaceae bacterium]